MTPSNPQSAIRNPQSAIRNPQSAIRNPKSAIRNPKSAIRNPKSSAPQSDIPQSEFRNPQSSAPQSNEILIVEDSPVEAEMLRRCLERAGYRVAVAQNGKQGLQAARAHRPALVISDINMPEMNGYQLCHEIKYDEALWNVPVILLTVLSEPKDIMRAISSGADGYITKPFVETSLLERIRALLSTPIRRKPSEERRSENVEYNGERYTITEGNQHTLNLLLSVYENNLSQNHDLTKVQAQLNQLNEHLEEQVRERTAALRESEGRYQVLMETAGEAIICIKAPDTITLWNKKAEELFGYTAAEAIGKALHQLIAPEQYRAEAIAGLKAFYRTGAGPIIGKTREISALRRDGTEFPIELSISAMQIKGEWQATGIISDITERKLLLEKLETSRKREQNARELASMERLSRTTQTSVTEQSFGVLPLRQSAPDLFNTLVQLFQSVTNMALEQRVLRVDYNISSELRNMAEQLGSVKAGPRDAIDIYTYAFKALSHDATAEKTQAYAEESRLLLLELLGHLVAFYRKYFTRINHRPASQTDTENNKENR